MSHQISLPYISLHVQMEVPHLWILNQLYSKCALKLKLHILQKFSVYLKRKKKEGEIVKLMSVFFTIFTFKVFDYQFLWRLVIKLDHSLTWLGSPLTVLTFYLVSISFFISQIWSGSTPLPRQNNSDLWIKLVPSKILTSINEVF